MAPELIASPYPDGHVIVTHGREGGIRRDRGHLRHRYAHHGVQLLLEQRQPVPEKRRSNPEARLAAGPPAPRRTTR